MDAEKELVKVRVEFTYDDGTTGHIEFSGAELRTRMITKFGAVAVFPPGQNDHREILRNGYKSLGLLISRFDAAECGKYISMPGEKVVLESGQLPWPKEW